MAKNDIAFTFGIITTGNVDDNLTKIIESIVNQVPIYEIIIVGNTKLTNKHATILPFNETIKKSWITRKKNLIAEQAKYDNIVLMHDYFILDDDWYNGYLRYIHEYGDFQIISNKIANCNGSRFRDWSLFPPFLRGDYGFSRHPNCEKIINQGCLLPYTFISNPFINKYIYYSGGYFVVKKELLLKFPLDEKLSWGQGEDVLWCKKLNEHGILFKFNSQSSVRLLKQKPDISWQRQIHDINLL